MYISNEYQQHMNLSRNKVKFTWFDMTDSYLES